MGYHRQTRCLCYLILGLFVFGCGGSGGKFRVTGQLQWEDGRPLKELAGYEVAFSSQDIHKSARGKIQDDGSFVLGTDREGDGALPAEYIVTVTQPHPMPERRGDKRRPIVDRDYEDPAKSPLQAIVKDPREGDNHFIFKLKPIGKFSQENS